MVQSNQPEDFDDLGRPISFTFKERVFNIPIPTPKKSKELMRMGRNIQRKSKELDKKIKEFEEKNEDVPDSILDETEKTFDFQLDFILTAGISEINPETGVTLDNVITKEFMEENWSNKLVQRVFRRVNESFVENDQEKKA